LVNTGADVASTRSESSTTPRENFRNLLMMFSFYLLATANIDVVAAPVDTSFGRLIVFNVDVHSAW
jgi:hypothetical protein